jgi:hypothetical protein
MKPNILVAGMRVNNAMECYAPSSKWETDEEATIETDMGD